MCGTHQRSMHPTRWPLPATPPAPPEPWAPKEPPRGLCLFSFKLSCTSNSISPGKTLSQDKPFLLCFPHIRLQELSSASGQTGCKINSRWPAFKEPFAWSDNSPLLFCSFSYMLISTLFYYLKPLSSFLILCYLRLVDLTFHSRELNLLSFPPPSSLILFIWL